MALPRPGVSVSRPLKAVPVDVGEPVLHSGVRPFAAADHPRPCWPGAQVQQLGELDDLTVVPDRPVGADRRPPGVGRDERDGVLDPLINGQADGVPDPALAAASQERAGHTGAVSPDQDLRTTLVLQAGRVGRACSGK